MKKIIACGILMFIVVSLFAQNPTDSIQVKKRLGTVFQQNGKNLTISKLLNITHSNPGAYNEMKIAEKNYYVSSVFGFTGGFMIGWPIGTSIGGGDPNWALAAIGAGLIAISIPFTVAYTKHAKSAVRIYNNGLKYSYLTKPDIKIGITFNGIGLKVVF